MNPDGVITVGVLSPHTAPGPEVEFPVMAPDRVRVRVARVRDRVPSSDGVADPSTAFTGLDDARRMATRDALHNAASTLFPGDVDVLALASTGSGYAIGHRAEAALLQALCERWEVPACSTSQSMVAALRSQHSERISLVHPPWFGYTLSHMGSEYFRSQGFEVIDAQLADLHAEPDQIRPAIVVEWVLQHLSDRAEAVVIGGNGFRAALAIDQLENSSGRLVLEANQVLLWSILTSTGTPVSVRGFGKLLEHHPNSGEPTTQGGPPVENATQLVHTANHVARTTRSHHVPRPTGPHPSAVSEPSSAMALEGSPSNGWYGRQIDQRPCPPDLSVAMSKRIER